MEFYLPPQGVSLTLGMDARLQSGFKTILSPWSPYSIPAQQEVDYMFLYSYTTTAQGYIFWVNDTEKYVVNSKEGALYSSAKKITLTVRPLPSSQTYRIGTLTIDDRSGRTITVQFRQVKNY